MTSGSEKVKVVDLTPLASMAMRPIGGWILDFVYRYVYRYKWTLVEITQGLWIQMGDQDLAHRLEKQIGDAEHYVGIISKIEEMQLDNDEYVVIMKVGRTKYILYVKYVSEEQLPEKEEEED